ncbi:unnamed protein product, partial [Amoebophrya sp. A120]
KISFLFQRENRETSKFYFYERTCRHIFLAAGKFGACLYGHLFPMLFFACSKRYRKDGVVEPEKAGPLLEHECGIEIDAQCR